MSTPTGKSAHFGWNDLATQAAILKQHFPKLHIDSTEQSYADVEGRPTEGFHPFIVPNAERLGNHRSTLFTEVIKVIDPNAVFEYDAWRSLELENRTASAYMSLMDCNTFRETLIIHGQLGERSYPLQPRDLEDKMRRDEDRFSASYRDQDRYYFAEFGIGAFEAAVMLLTNPARRSDPRGILCTGDRIVGLPREKNNWPYVLIDTLGPVLRVRPLSPSYTGLDTYATGYRVECTKSLATHNRQGWDFDLTGDD